MKGGPSKEPRGFTIIETLIVLTVTGVILGAALTLIGGRQNRTQFTVGIGQVQQQVQQAISEVKNGYYPNNGQIKCAAGSNGPDLSIGSNGQGQNSGCIFLGKAIQFAPSGNDEQMVLIPIAANRLSDGKQVSTLAQAKPVAIAPLAADDTATPNATEGRNFTNGIHVVDMWRNGNRADKIGAIAILFDLSNVGYDANGTLTPGSLQTSLYVVGGTAIGQTTSDVSAAIKGTGGATRLTNASLLRVDVCFASGSTNQSGQLTIGGTSSSDSNGGELSVRMQIMDGTSCGSL